MSGLIQTLRPDTILHWKPSRDLLAVLTSYGLVVGAIYPWSG